MRRDLDSFDKTEKRIFKVVGAGMFIYLLFILAFWVGVIALIWHFVLA